MNLGGNLLISSVYSTPQNRSPSQVEQEIKRPRRGSPACRPLVLHALCAVLSEWLAAGSRPRIHLETVVELADYP